MKLSCGLSISGRTLLIPAVATDHGHRRSTCAIRRRLTDHKRQTMDETRRSISRRILGEESRPGKCHIPWKIPLRPLLRTSMAGRRGRRTYHRLLRGNRCSVRCLGGTERRAHRSRPAGLVACGRCSDGPGMAHGRPTLALVAYSNDRRGFAVGLSVMDCSPPPYRIATFSAPPDHLRRKSRSSARGGGRRGGPDRGFPGAALPVQAIRRPQIYVWNLASDISIGSSSCVSW